MYVHICVDIHVSILSNFCSSLYLSALISLINLFLLKLPPAALAEQTHKQKKPLFNTFQWQFWGLQTLTIVTMTGQAYVTCLEWVSEFSPPEANSEAGVIPSGKSDWLIKDAGWGKAKPGSQTAGSSFLVKTCQVFIVHVEYPPLTAACSAVFGHARLRKNPTLFHSDTQNYNYTFI